MTTSETATSGKVEVELKLPRQEAMIRVQCDRRAHPAARLMVALRELELEVYYANVMVVKGMIDTVGHREDGEQLTTAICPSRIAFSTSLLSVTTRLHFGAASARVVLESFLRCVHCEPNQEKTFHKIH